MKDTLHTTFFDLCITTFILVVWFIIPQHSHAYFSDEVSADESVFLASTLAINADDTNHALNIEDTGTSTLTFTAASTGSIDTQFLITAEPTACDPSFYNGLSVTATENIPRYAGAISGLAATSTSAGTWELAFSASGALMASENEECEITLTVTGWQDLFPMVNTGGFSDEVVVTLIITAIEDIGAQPTATIVLNEIYPAPISTSTEPLEREWVELYNGTNMSVDVSGWVIGEMSGTSTVQRHEIVSECPADNVSKYAEPYGGANTEIVPGGQLVVQFCGAGSYLNNSGDTVSLYTSTSSITSVDEYTYSEKDAGNSHARIPDGSTWVDPVPTPGTPNAATEAELRAEGWSDEEITRVLGTLNNTDSDFETEESTTTKSNGLQSLGNEEAKLDDEPEDGNSIEEIDDASGEDDIEDTGSSEVGIENKDTLVENEVEVQTQTVEERSIEGKNEDINVTSEELDAGEFEEENKETITDSGTEAAESKTESVEENESIGSEGESTDESNSPDAAEIEPEESESQTDTANTGDAAISNPATA